MPPKQGIRQFGGVSRFGAFQQASGRSTQSVTPAGSRATQLGLGLGKGGAGLGKAGKQFKRHRIKPRDTIKGITKGDMRRLARRGGVKRMSAMVYDDMRQVLKSRLELILRQVTAVIECSGRKTITATDIVFVLNRLGRPLYGFEPQFHGVR